MTAPDTAPDEATFRLLHEVRLRGVVEIRETESVTTLIAESLIEEGFVARSTRGLRITSVGRVTHASWARLVAGGDDEQVARRAYERFLPLNRELLQICSDWQVQPGGIPNDHRDPRYDWAIIERLRALDERIAPVVSRLGRAVERFAAYRPRLRMAFAHVDDGDTEWLTSPRIDSYHTVWMQLHEDLLLAIGGDRSNELGEHGEPGDPAE